MNAVSASPRRSADARSEHRGYAASDRHVAGNVLYRAVEGDQIKVADHRASLRQDRAAGSPCGSQDLHPAELAADQGLLAVQMQPLAQRVRLGFAPDQLHEGAGVQV